jgi:beta-1,4-N-acetylglucosaminyltransferase
MKIFVTVGTTRFDSLIKYLDIELSGTSHELIFQISDGKYEPLNFNFFRYTQNIVEYYKKNDVVITHAGAGSIYGLLELRKKMIIVPNMERLDKHQSDIASYMHENEYARAVFKFDHLSDSINSIDSFEPKFFEKTPFNKARQILDYFSKPN